MLTKDLKRGDPCPACGGEFRDAPVPTDAQRAEAARKEDPTPIPPHMDTASPEFRAEYGGLARCTSCSYQTRFPLKAAKPAKAAE